MNSAIEHSARTITICIGIIGLVLTFWFTTEQYLKYYYPDPPNFFFPTIYSDNGNVPNDKEEKKEAAPMSLIKRERKIRYIPKEKRQLVKQNKDVFSRIARSFGKVFLSKDG